MPTTQPQTDDFIHTRAEHLEKCIDAARFLSLFATTTVCMQGVIAAIAISILVAYYRRVPPLAGQVEHIGEALIALVVAWIMHPPIYFRNR